MNLETQIRSAFDSDPTFSGLLTGGLYLVRLPQNPSYPCGIFVRVGTRPIYSQGPRGGSQAHVGSARFQFQFWSTSTTPEVELEALYQAMLGVLAGFSAYALPASPPLANQAPNFVISRTMGIESETQPQAWYIRCDVNVWYQDQ